MSHIVALIEDEEAIRELYRLKLEAEGFKVLTATNGEEGLKILDEHNPHVALLDIMMPDIDGIEVLKIATKKEILPKSVVILTNLPYETARDMAKPFPVAGIFIKMETTPVTVADTVRKLLAE